MGSLLLMSEDRSRELAEALERLSELSITQLREILSSPLDLENGSLLRAKTTAAAVALNTQLRADALRLRAAREDRALEVLLERIEAKRECVPVYVAPDA